MSIRIKEAIADGSATGQNDFPRYPNSIPIQSHDRRICVATRQRGSPPRDPRKPGEVPEDISSRAPVCHDHDQDTRWQATQRRWHHNVLLVRQETHRQGVNRPRRRAGHRRGLDMHREERTDARRRPDQASTSNHQRLPRQSDSITPGLGGK
jgi:hypothetical protein